MCALCRWVRVPDEAGPGGGIDCETGRGSSLMQVGEGMGEKMPWQQRRQQRADAGGHKTPEAWSDLGSFVKSALSEDERQADKVVSS